MDMLGVSKSPKQSKRSRTTKGVKVVYISSPMKVKTSASKFRALVQELTGRDSDAERYMETNSPQNVHDFSHHQQQQLKADDHHGQYHVQIPFSSSIYEFPNCSSDSFFEPLAGNFDMDVLRSFNQI